MGEAAFNANDREEYRWTLRLYSGNKIVCKLQGTVESPPNGKVITNVLKKIIPKEYFYVF